MKGLCPRNTHSQQREYDLARQFTSWVTIDGQNGHRLHHVLDSHLHNYASKMTTVLTSSDLAELYLATDIEDGLVYCIPRKVVDHCIVDPDKGTLLHNKTTLRNLLTGEPLVIPKASLLEFAVPDGQLGSYLMDFGVRGIQAPYQTKPHTKDPFEIPLHGNVTDPKWAFISLGGACNSRCVFCYTDWLRSVPDLRASQIRDLINRIAELGVKDLVFSGGEATIRQDLISLVEYAKQAGFTRIGLQTHGRALRERDLVRQLVEAGITSVLLSLHGPDETIHDGITGIPGSFSEAIGGLQNLRSFPIWLTINSVMCKQNYRYLSEIVTLIAQLLDSNGTMRFSYPIVEGAAFVNSDKILVTFSELRPSLLHAIELAQKLKLATEVANMPLCVFGNCDTTYDKVQQGEFVEASPFYKFNIPRGEKSVKFRKCVQCNKFTLCPGIQVEYLRVFPNSCEEFVAV